MAIKLAVNRRISELEGFAKVLNGISAEARRLKSQYESEKTRVSEDFDSIGLVNPDAEKLDRLKDQHLLADDKVKKAKEELTKLLASIKKDALSLAKNSQGIKEEQENLKKLESAKKNARLKIESKQRRLTMLDGTAKNELQKEIDKDELDFLGYDKKILDQGIVVQNIQDSIDSYEAYKVVYNKYAIEKLSEYTDVEKNVDEAIVTPKATPVVDESVNSSVSQSGEPVNSTGEVPETAAIPIDEVVPEVIEVIEPIEDRKTFDELYKKLKNNKITAEEKLRLYETIKDKSKYAKLGITTGMIYNESRKILKSETEDLREEMAKFFKNNGTFEKDISVNKFYKSEEYLNNDRFGLIKDIADGKKYHVEGYILEMKEYIEAGNIITPKQQKIYDDGLKLQSKIDRLREGLIVNNEVKEEKNQKDPTQSFGDKIKRWLFRDDYALPEAAKKENELDKKEEIKEDVKPEFHDILNNLVNKGDLSKERSEELGKMYDDIEKGKENVDGAKKSDAKDDGMYP